MLERLALPRWHWVTLGCATAVAVALVSYDWLAHGNPYRQLLSTLGLAVTVLLFALFSSAALVLFGPTVRAFVAVPVYLVTLLFCMYLVGTSADIFLEPLVFRLLGPPHGAGARQ